MKNERQNVILKIIAENRIETQNQLIQALRENGVRSTQATVSRDIRELRLVKEPDEDGVSRYVCPTEQTALPDHSERLRTIFRESVTSCCCAQNIVVVRTLSGLANAACTAIDSMKVPDMAGSLAGDDTIFLAMTDNAAAERMCREMQELLR